MSEYNGKAVRVKKIVEYVRHIYKDVEYIGSENANVLSFSSLQDLRDGGIIWFRGISNVTAGVLSKLKEILNALIISDKETKDYILARLVESDDGSNHKLNFIVTSTPRDVYFSILSHFFCFERTSKIEWDKSVIETVMIGENVSIGANCYIGPDVEIGNNVSIHNNVVIECPTIIGEYTNIYSGVTIGTNGFGYYNENGVSVQIPHFKGVKIGNNVDIGANTCVDRGCLTDTKIGNYVKIDNLVHIAHNVQIADHCIVVAQAMIAGSSTIGENTYIAPGVRIIDQIRIGQNVLIGMGAVVKDSISDNKVAVGVPAREIKDRGKH